MPLLAQATPFIGHFQIRNRGTIGGSIAHADPAAEYPAVALALDAEFEVASAAGAARIPAARVLRRASGPPPPSPTSCSSACRSRSWGGRCGFAVEEFARRHGDFAIAGAAVGVELDGDDRIARCAIGLFGMGSTPVRADAAEAALVGPPDRATSSPPRSAGWRWPASTSVPADLHGSAAYRTRVGAAMVARAPGRRARRGGASMADVAGRS